MYLLNWDITKIPNRYFWRNGVIILTIGHSVCLLMKFISSVPIVSKKFIKDISVKSYCHYVVTFFSKNLLFLPD